MSFLFTVNDESRIRILLEDIPPGNYGVFADFAKVPDGCAFSLWEREARISEWIPGDTASRQRVKELFLGNISIHSSRPTFTFQFRTDSIHNVFFLNRLKLINRKAIHRPAG
jgi:hypothetical protein